MMFKIRKKQNAYMICSYLVITDDQKSIENIMAETKTNGNLNSLKVMAEDLRNKLVWCSGATVFETNIHEAGIL